MLPAVVLRVSSSPRRAGVCNAFVRLVAGNFVTVDRSFRLVWDKILTKVQILLSEMRLTQIIKNRGKHRGQFFLFQQNPNPDQLEEVRR
jgi:hypothetical protein